ncbi:MAG: type I methionyl aminopeptidase [Myxococcales bacterium]|nr:type I methionyl aminopeptidase [Myxococcales bacterium]
MSSRMVEQMRVSCQMAAECLVAVGEVIAPGVTTDAIDRFVHEFITSRDAYPSPLNYKGFPKSVCTSVNEVVCHGIPGPRRLEDGDIVNVDVTTYYPKEHGYHGDTSVTYYVGEPSEDAKRVTETARRCLELGIEQVRHGARIRDIGAAIEDYATSRGCSVVRDYVGHGVGREFHMPPQIPHYRYRGPNPRMREGMVFTIEPMINLGDYRTELQADDWTVLTKDRRLSAQFEHSLLVTRTGCEVLTRRDEVVKNSEDKPWSDVGPRSAPAAYALRPAAGA